MPDRAATWAPLFNKSLVRLDPGKQGCMTWPWKAGLYDMTLESRVVWLDPGKQGCMTWPWKAGLYDLTLESRVVWRPWKTGFGPCVCHSRGRCLTTKPAVHCTRTINYTWFAFLTGKADITTGQQLGIADALESPSHILSKSSLCPYSTSSKGLDKAPFVWK